MRPGSGVPQPSPAKNRLVLVVDEDAVVVATTAEVLRNAGYTVTTAEDGAQALQRMAELSPFAVLLDPGMPVVHGEEFANRVRARGSGAKLLVMAGDDDARVLAAHMHADGYLTKPF